MFEEYFELNDLLESLYESGSLTDDDVDNMLTSYVNVFCEKSAYNKAVGKYLSEVNEWLAKAKKLKKEIDNPYNLEKDKKAARDKLYAILTKIDSIEAVAKKEAVNNIEFPDNEIEDLKRIVKYHVSKNFDTKRDPERFIDANIAFKDRKAMAEKPLTGNPFTDKKIKEARESIRKNKQDWIKAHSNKKVVNESSELVDHLFEATSLGYFTYDDIELILSKI